MQSELNLLKNVIIGFDIANSLVRIFRLSGTDASSAVCNDIKVEKALLDRGEFGEALRSAITYYTKNIADIPSAYIVMPDRLVSSDYIQLPKMNKKKVIDSLRGEIVKYYANSVNLNVLTVQVDTPKDNLDYNLFFVTLGNMNFINDISTGLARSSVQPRTFTFSAPCSLNAMLERRSDLRGKNFVFADIRSYSTILTVCSNGIIRGYYDMPFGVNVLRSDMLFPENGLYDNTVATEAVDAAIIKASGGKAPSTIKPLPDFENQDLPDSEKVKKKLEYLNTLFPEQLKIVPESQEEMDVLYANFSIIEKHIDMFVASNSGSNDIPKIDFVVVNLPEEFYFIKDILGESDKKIPYEFLDNRNKNRAYVGNFDLYGALLLRRFNTEQIF